MEEALFGLSLPRDFWNLSDKEMEEVFINNADYSSLLFSHKFIRRHLISFLSARNTLQMHDEYPSVDECRANTSIVGGLYKDRPNASPRPAWFRKVDAQHDVSLRHVKVQSAKCAWMLEKLSRDLFAPSVRHSVVAGVSAIANIVVPWIAGSGALTIGPVNVLAWGLVFSTGLAATTWFSLWLVRRCLHTAKQLGLIVKREAYTLEEKHISQWSSWDWVWIDEVVLPAVLSLIGI